METIQTSRPDLLKKLSEKIPYQWRVQSFSKTKPEATCVAYIDARDVMNLLDAHCSEGWQNDYKEIKGNLFCGIGIKINNEWEWRWDCGTESNTEKEKGEASDSFKRAAVKWGIGRFLYDLEIVRVPANTTNKQVVDAEGKTVWNITKHINEKKHLIKATEKQPEKTTADPLKTARPENTDNRPPISEKWFQQALERISAGETGVIEKTEKACKIPADKLQHLKDAEKEVKQSQNVA